MEKCPFCMPPTKVLQGSGMIVPKAHGETVFNLSETEILDTFRLLNKVKELMDKELNPDGYNVGWNCNSVGGQSVFHAHLHIIPRFQDEPLAGKGIRHHLKQESNIRKSLRLNG